MEKIKGDLSPPPGKVFHQRIAEKSSRNKWRKQWGNFAPLKQNFLKIFLKKRSLIMNVEIAAL